MRVQRIAAFSRNGAGGNAAGVVLLDRTAPEADMRRVAAEVGYSETVFAVPVPGADKTWRLRYFSPESEVPFCGHATIALGAALAERGGPGTYDLMLNDAAITVTAGMVDGQMAVTLTSPPTASRPATETEASDAMALFGLQAHDLDPRLPPARIHGGADHIMLALHSRARLAAMEYRLTEGRAVMQRHGLVTIMLVFVEGENRFAVRNAFASGGVPEDPATGAAAAAFAGYLRDRGWPHGGGFTIRQGDDMGVPSTIRVQLTDVAGAPVQIAGQTRPIAPD
jgi:PhzF family phenazine biosynthesis protein